MMRRGHSTTHECPCCGANNEDSLHIFQCQDEEMSKAFDEGIDKISDYLQITTSSEIKNKLIETLLLFRHGPGEIEETATALPTTLPQQAALQQYQIGITASLNGIWSKKWIEAQDLHLRRSHSRKSGKVWLTRLTTRLQFFLHSLWKARNEAIHQREDSNNNKKQHEALDHKISAIYKSLPALRLLPTCDAAFFKRGEIRTKKYRIRRKELWVEEATRIRDAFFDSLDPQAESFLNYFATAT